MKIYNHIGEEVADILVSETSYRYRTIMGENALTVTARLPQTLSLTVGCFVDYQGERYTIQKPESIKKNGKRDYEYTIIFESSQSSLAKYIVLGYDGRIKFSMTATPLEHLQLIVYNLNQKESGWTIGSCVEAEPKTISYSHTFTEDGLRLIATEFNTEFEVVGKKINLGKVEYNKDNPLPLSYRNGFKVGVEKRNFDNTKAIEVLYVQGGEKNIDPSTYGSRELLLPKSATYIYQGRQYITDAQGLSLRRGDKPLFTKQEGCLDCTHIHPKRVGSVTFVQEVNAEKNFWDIFDSTIPESLNYSLYRIAGEKATIVFQTGLLAGREFDILQTETQMSGYIHSERRFKLVPTEIDGHIMPSSTLRPQAGDKYIVFGCSMPWAYISDNATQTGASWEMLKEAVKYKYENEDPRYSFVGRLDGVWSKSRWLEIGGKIKPGAYILFSDENIQAEEVLMRIVGVKDYINSPEKPEIELSNITIGGTYRDKIEKIEQGEVVIEDKAKESKRYTQRRFSDAQRTIQLIQDAIEGFSGPINPISIMTMAILVGSESLQFRFVNNKTTPSVTSPSFVFDGAAKTFAAPSGIIQHMSLGINSIKKTHSADEYKYWDIASYLSPALMDEKKAYYLYARCNKANSTAVYLLSESAMPFDSDANYYYLLVGTLGDGQNRSFVPLYGFTEILPGRITTDKIVSPTGKTYFDLSAGDGDGEIGGKITFRDTGGNKKNLEQFAQGLEALQGSTTIQGGLILTNVLALRGIDNVIRAGMSGLSNDNVFLFADTVNAYQKALAGTAQFLLRKDGTARLSIMRINSNTIGMYNGDKEVVQFRTTPIPSLSDLVSSLDLTINYTGGSYSGFGEVESNFGMSSVIEVTSLDSFSLAVTGTLGASVNNSPNTPLPLSTAQINLKLYKLVSGVYLFDRVIDTAGVSYEGIGVESQMKYVDALLQLGSGSYKIQAEYYCFCKETDNAQVSATGISARARGAAANECMIFGTNGFVRIKDGYNYDYFSDAVCKFSRGEDKHILVDGNKAQIKGAFDAPGLLAAGSVTAAGGLTTSFGKAEGSSRTSTGLFTVTHSIGHSLYSVNLTLFNSGAQVTAVVTSKNNTSFNVRIVNPSNNGLTDSAFDFSVYGSN